MFLKGAIGLVAAGSTSYILTRLGFFGTTKVFICKDEVPNPITYNILYEIYTHTNPLPLVLRPKKVISIKPIEIVRTEDTWEELNKPPKIFRSR